MALTQRLELRQGQSLVMTPQLQQAIKLLQLSNLELAEYVEAELERNPLLERDDSAEGERQPAESASVTEAAADAPLDQAMEREEFSADSGQRRTGHASAGGRYACGAHDRLDAHRRRRTHG